jgi:hypothetical protein
MAITSKGKLYGWGENKYYIMGLTKTEYEGKKSKRIEVIFEPEELFVNKHLGVKLFYLI